MIAALNQFLIYIEMGRLRLKRVKEQGHSMNRAGRGVIRRRIPQSGTHSKRKRKRSDSYDHGDDVCNRDQDQRA